MITIVIKNQNVNFGMVSLNKSLNPLFKGLKPKPDQSAISLRVVFSNNYPSQKKPKSKTVKENIERVLAKSNNLAFRRDEFKQCGSYREVSRAIATLINEDKLIRLARGFFIKSTPSTNYAKLDFPIPVKAPEFNMDNLEKSHSKHFIYREYFVQTQEQNHCQVKPKKSDTNFRSRIKCNYLIRPSFPIRINLKFSRPVPIW